MKRLEEELIIKGHPISPGVAIGVPFFLLKAEEDIPNFAISEQNIETEIDRYRTAVHHSREELQCLQETMDGPSEATSILETHLEMLHDPLITTEMEQRIRDMKKNSESVFHLVVEEFKKKINHIGDEVFKERVNDITDLSHRILTHLRPFQRNSISEIPINSILLAHELVPSDTIEAKTENVNAFVTTVGGFTSHAAIIARAKGIPYVANINIQRLRKIKIKALIVDGTTGVIVVNPKEATLQSYQQLGQRSKTVYHTLEKESDHLAETLDGCSISILGNLEGLKDIELLKKYKASGIGLFRSEYLFLQSKKMPQEEEQFAFYRQLVEALPEQRVAIRVFDIGGDKQIHSTSEETNPALGCRAIRFLLQNPTIFEKQIRALLRASLYGNVQILLPMVSDVSELRKVRHFIEQTRLNLCKEGVKLKREVPIGCMIEVPSSAIMSDVLACESDFLSIGTNDLIQYVLAVDRNNPKVSDLYAPFYPSVIRLLRLVVSAAKRFNKSLVLCGEIGADPKYIPLLLGLGIRQFSVSPRHIPKVKQAIRQIEMRKAHQMAEKALSFSSGEELRSYLDKQWEKQGTV